MLLKLVMPPVNRMIQGGYIRTWYKAEGDWVDYGEDLFEMEIRARLLRATKDYPEMIRMLVSAGGPDAPVPSFVEIVDAEPRISARVTSSDRGFLRRICAEAGTFYKSGELVGVMSNDLAEAIEADPRSLDGANVFRVVANL